MCTSLAGCPLSALGGGAALTPHCTALCAHWTTGLSIANGCVCLTGVVTGAQATYICDDGYMLEGGTRDCMDDGAWSGTSSPTCSKVRSHNCTHISPCILPSLQHFHHLHPSLYHPSHHLLPSPTSPLSSQTNTSSVIPAGSAGD